MRHRQTILAAIVAVCVIILLAWWTDAVGARWQYSLSRVSWAPSTNAPGTGAVTFSVGEAPTEDMLGAVVKAVRVTGLQPAAGLTTAQLAAAEAAVDGFAGGVVTGISVVGKSVTIGKNATAPKTWPSGTAWATNIMSGQLTLLPGQ